MICLGPGDPGEIVDPRPLSGVVVRPLNFTVRRRAHKGSNVVIASRALRFVTALASSVLIGIVTMFLIGFLLPWAIVALRYGTGPGAGDAVFVWMLLFVPLAAALALSLVIFVTVLMYRRLAGPASDAKRVV